MTNRTNHLYIVRNADGEAFHKCWVCATYTDDPDHTCDDETRRLTDTEIAAAQAAGHRVVGDRFVRINGAAFRKLANREGYIGRVTSSSPASIRTI